MHRAGEGYSPRKGLAWTSRGDVARGAFGQGAPGGRALPPGQLGAPLRRRPPSGRPPGAGGVMVSQTSNCAWVSPGACQLPQLPALPPSPLTQAGRVSALGHLLTPPQATDRSPCQLPRWGRGCQERCPQKFFQQLPPFCRSSANPPCVGRCQHLHTRGPPFPELMLSQRWGPLPGGTRAYEQTGQDGAVGSRDSAVGRRVGARTEPPGDCPFSLPVRTALCPNGPARPRPAAGSQHPSP